MLTPFIDFLFPNNVHYFINGEARIALQLLKLETSKFGSGSFTTESYTLKCQMNLVGATNGKFVISLYIVFNIWVV
ncbi:hypothetical protein LguiA_031796 [Lonicera macranthoides]